MRLNLKKTDLNLIQAALDIYIMDLDSDAGDSPLQTQRKEWIAEASALQDKLSTLVARDSIRRGIYASSDPE